ncbi:MAG: segregation/condensation protein A [Lachnospiraceae bacterium]|nr:segregation/condensation protein A [Lachnospiraceae bacterium]
MAIPVKLEVFEGPLDLLLHLIEKNKVDIYDIPIVEITKQYLEYVKQLPQDDLNTVSEFMVMAATLLDIKCKMLLPKEVDEEGEEEDPRAELVQKLLEYKMYKYMSYELKDMQMDGDKFLYKQPTIPDEVKNYKAPIDYDELIGDTTLIRLNEIFNICLKRIDDKVDPIRSQFGKIEKEEVDISQKQNFISDYISSHKKCSFKNLLSKQRSKMEVIVTFLVVLELIKTGSVTVSQDETFGDINIEYQKPIEQVEIE